MISVATMPCRGASRHKGTRPPLMRDEGVDGQGTQALASACGAAGAPCAPRTGCFSVSWCGRKKSPGRYSSSL